MRGITAITLVARASALGVWDARRWHLSLDIGREAGTNMAADWAASGARLGLPLDVEVDGELAKARDEDVLRASRIRPLAPPTLVNDLGEQTVDVAEGGWHLEAGETLRFWLDFGPSKDAGGAAARRQDVSFPAGRCYFDAKALAAARDALLPLEAETEALQQELEARLDHAGGDRRLDGTDLLDTAAAYGDVATLVGRRDLARSRQRALEEELRWPGDASAVAFGAWPGAGEDLGLGPGRVYVRRRAFFSDDFDVVGTWRARPLADADG